MCTDLFTHLINNCTKVTFKNLKQNCMLHVILTIVHSDLLQQIYWIKISPKLKLFLRWANYYTENEMNISLSSYRTELKNNGISYFLFYNINCSSLIIKFLLVQLLTEHLPTVPNRTSVIFVNFSKRNLSIESSTVEMTHLVKFKNSYTFN